MSWGRAVWGYSAQALGNYSSSRLKLAEAIEIAIEINGFLTMMLALPAVALIMLKQDEVERGVELYALANRYPLVARSQWRRDVIADCFAEATAVLPTIVIEAAKSRGQTLDLWSTAREIAKELSVK